MDLFFPNMVRVPRGETMLVDFEIQVRWFMFMILKEYHHQMMFSTSNHRVLCWFREVVYSEHLYETKIISVLSIVVIEDHIMVPVDNHSNEDYIIKRGEVISISTSIFETN